MGLSTLLAQVGAPTSAWDMVFGGSLPTRLVLLVLAVSSVASWILIFWKARQFRTVRQQGNRFLEQIERAMIEKCVRHYGGNLSRVAEALGLSRPSLYRRLRKYGINTEVA